MERVPRWRSVSRSGAVERRCKRRRRSLSVRPLACGLLAQPVRRSGGEVLLGRADGAAGLKPELVGSQVGVVALIASGGLVAAEGALVVRQTGHKITRVAHGAEHVESKDGRFVQEAVKCFVLQQVEASCVDEADEGGADRGGRCVREGSILVHKLNGLEELIQPVRCFVLKLHGAQLAVELGRQGLEGDVDKRVHVEVVANGVDLIAGDKVGLGAGSEFGNVADASVDVANQPLDSDGLKVANLDMARFGLLKMAGQSLFEPNTARTEDVLVKVPCLIAAFDCHVGEEA